MRSCKRLWTPCATWFYETASKAGSVAVHDELSPEEIPEEMRQIRARMKHVERLTNEKFLLDKILADDKK